MARVRLNVTHILKETVTFVLVPVAVTGGVGMTVLARVGKEMNCQADVFQVFEEFAGAIVVVAVPMLIELAKLLKSEIAIGGDGGDGDDVAKAAIGMGDVETAFHDESIEVPAREGVILRGERVVFDGSVLDVWRASDDDVESAVVDDDVVEVREPVEGTGLAFHSARRLG